MAMLLVSGLLAMNTVAPIELTPGVDPIPIVDRVSYLVDEHATMTLEEVVAMNAEFVANHEALVNPGMPTGVVWVRVPVRNVGSEPATWVLSLNRYAVRVAEIHQVDNDGERLLLANTSESFAASFKSYGTLAAPVHLGAGARADLYVRYRGANWSGLDLRLTTPDTLTAEGVRRLVVFFLLMGGIGTLVLYGSISFVFLGAQVVLLYALAQVALFVFYAHMGGFTTVYLWPDDPQAGRVVAPIVLGCFVTAMAQFARLFFETRTALPRLDKALVSAIGIGAAAIVVTPLDYWVAAIDSRLGVYMVYAATIVTWLTLPPLALYATISWHRDHWPIAVAWSLMGSFLVAMLLVFLGVFPTLPLGIEAYGVIAYLEALFLAMAIALRIRRIRTEREQAERQLSTSLKSELAASQRAIQLAEQREVAIRDLAEKGRLLLATGHDTRQMLAALRHFARGLQREGTDFGRTQRAGREISQIAESLNEVLTTAIEGSSSGGIADDVCALEWIDPAQLLNPLALIHGSEANSKGLELRVKTTHAPLVVDRVLASRILGNLISNAIKYTDRGKVLVTCRRCAAGHRFQVIDTGRGLSNDHLTRLLDPQAGAVQFGNSADGQGAGFAIAKQFTARIGGTLIGRSVHGHGTILELIIPACDHPWSLNFDEILLADGDEEQHRAIAKIARILRVGRVARLAGDADPSDLGADTRRLILVDQHFGGTDRGAELATRLRDALPHAAVALLSYDHSIDVRVRLGRAVSLLLYKPLSPALVGAAMQHALRLEMD